ncbi:DUF424 domain-containing protein [Methanococcoides burtonii]|uniref:DUF424 domain-containing protein n=1 Tax=Methanococcoides burtonii (strain DSM 6242 / NBRC 107633 / OCM 468 / ACE-M) TaxID=259564 RepID=Q12TE4_METBU|nr:DUF424 domain-containing protein [Methanococcoides burtonii]ABE53282.1 Protein of unknown function DUF424 [Methanococcoides burtonii DSM 6242]
MYLKIHRSTNQILVAVCDKELVGKKLTKGEIVIDISEGFYKGEIASEETIVQAIRNAPSANIFGTRSIQCAIDSGAVDPECVIYIEGTPHAQIYKL